MGCWVKVGGIEYPCLIDANGGYFVFGCSVPYSPRDLTSASTDLIMLGNFFLHGGEFLTKKDLSNHEFKTPSILLSQLIACNS